MTRTKSELKRWARENMRGVENTLFPSFTPDLRELDEEGIRHDVRQSIAHGFFSTMCATETGLTLEEAERFIAIAADEARGKILVTTSLILNSFEENMALLEHAERVGLDGVLLGYPPTFHPEDREEVYRHTRRFCDATRLHVTLYPSPHFPFDRFHASGFPLDVMSRLADLENVVAIKVGELGLFADAQRLCGDRVLVGCPVERYVPLLVQGFGMQWMGAGCYEVLQSPEQPNLVEYFRLLREGRSQAGMEIYWKLAPMRNLFEQQFNQTVMSGTYNWHAQKYYQWCVGGNGGLTRQPAMKLHSWEINQIRMGFYAIGIEPREPEEEFWVGRASYARLPAAVATAEERRGPAAGELSARHGSAPASLAERTARVAGVLRELADELRRAPMLIRPMVVASLSSATGRGLEAWQSSVAQLEEALARGAPPPEDSLGRDLERLALYFDEAPERSKRFVSSHDDLAALEQRSAARAAEVRALGSALR